MNTSEVLNTAADLIEEHGWTQGHEGWRGHDSGLCLEGALAAALGLGARAGERLAVYACPAYAAVADYLDLQPMPKIAPVRDSLWGWNDRQNRTATEVIATLRAAAVIEAAKETHARKVDAVRTLHGNTAADRLAARA